MHFGSSKLLNSKFFCFRRSMVTRFWDCGFRPIACLIAFCVACAFPLLSHAQDTLNDDMMALSTKISKHDGDISLLGEGAGQLLAALRKQEVDARPFAALPLTLAHAENLLKKIEALDLAISSEAYDKWSSLAILADELTAEFSRSELARRAAALEKLYENNADVQSGDLRVSGIDELLSEIIGAEQSARPMNTLSNLAEIATTMLGDADIASGINAAVLSEVKALRKASAGAAYQLAPATEAQERASEMVTIVNQIKDKFPTNADLAKAFGDLKTALDAALTDVKPQIFVTAAWYGVREELKLRTGRRCNAILTMRARCRTAANCSLPSDKWGEQLCGSEPAPYLPFARKGVRVSYKCLPPGEIDPTDYTVRIVRLTAIGEKISCEVPR